MAVNPSAWIRPDRLVGMTAPMLLWALHFVLVYSLAGVGCEHDWYRATLLGTNRLSLLLVVATIAALVPIALLGWRALRWHRHGTSAADASLPRHGRFLVRVTLALSVLAAIAVLFTATPILLLPPCAT